MIKKTILFSLALSINFLFAQSTWNINFIKYKKATIRTGLLKSDSLTSLGTILYLQGLGDSMMNHAPLFNHLNRNGYNIIAFDYMGQGGST